MESGKWKSTFPLSLSLQVHLAKKFLQLGSGQKKLNQKKKKLEGKLAKGTLVSRPKKKKLEKVGRKMENDITGDDPSKGVSG